MNLYPLNLGVRQSSGAEKVNPAKQKSLAEKAQARDDFTCRFCGFQSKLYQRAIPWIEAGNPPLATACVFCEQCLNLERASVTGAGLLIWLPEISQADLHHLVRAIYVARLEKSPVADLATRALDALTVRRSEAKRRLGSDDPLLLATILRESLDDKEITTAIAKLDGIRLLPSEKYMVRGSKGDVNQFPQLVKYWASPDGPYGKWPAAKWQEVLQKAVSQTGHAPGTANVA